MSFKDNLAVKLKDARKALGLSTREVAERISVSYKVSHTTIANLEKSLSVPNIELLSLLAVLYQRPINWFLTQSRTLTGIQYRDYKSKVSVADRQRYEAESLRWLEAYSHLEVHLGTELSCGQDHLRYWDELRPSTSGREAAENLRQILNLGDRAVPSVAELLTDFGIRAIELASEASIDGFAARLGEEAIVVLNPTLSNDRARLNASHELGHILFGDCDTPNTAKSKAAELRVFEFGSHLLLPETQLQKAFHGQSMVRLVHFKEQFGISIGAMVMRAQKVGIISQEAAKWLWIEFSKRGWRKQEPGFVRPDRATRFEELLAGSVAANRLTWRAAAELLNVREEEIHRRMSIALGGKADAVEGSSEATIPIR